MDGLDSDVVRTWQLIGELTDQLNSSKALVVALQNQADELKERAATEHGQHSTKLRRFDVEIAKETFESEAERAHAAIVLENHSLLYENNQLSSLLKEYEESLETIMNKFKMHAQSSAQHQLNMRQHYEHLIGAVSSGTLSPEEEEAKKIFHQSAARLQLLLKHTIKALTEPPHSSQPSSTESKPEASTSDPNNRLSTHAGSGSGLGGSGPPNRPSSVVPAGASEFHESHPHEHGSGPSGVSPIDDLSIEALLSKALSEDGHGPSLSEDQLIDCNWDWATTREHEIARLEAENALLRQHLLITPGSLAEYAQSVGLAPPPDAVNPEEETQSIGPGLSIRAKVDGENRLKLRQSGSGKALASPSPSGGSGSGFGGLGLGGMMGGGPGGRLREFSPPTGIGGGGGPGERGGGGGGMGSAGAFGPLRAPPNRRPPPFPGSFGGSGSPISPVGMGPGASDERGDLDGAGEIEEEGVVESGGGGGSGRPGSPMGLYRNIALPSEADEAEEGDIEGEGTIEAEPLEGEGEPEREIGEGEHERDSEEDPH